MASDRPQPSGPSTSLKRSRGSMDGANDMHHNTHDAQDDETVINVPLHPSKSNLALNDTQQDINGQDTIHDIVLPQDDQAPAYQPEQLPSTLREPAALVESGVLFDPSYVLYDVHLTVLTQDASSASDPSASSSAPSSGSVAGKITDKQLRPLTQDDIDAAKPHPGALFCPATMQWVLVIPTGESLDDDEAETSSPNSAWFPIFETSDMFSLTEEDWPQAIPPIRYPVYDHATRQRSSQRLQGPFLSHTAQAVGLIPQNKSERMFISALVPSGFPPRLLSDLRKSRRENPPPGQDPDTSVFSAFRTLIRIIVNASKADERFMPADSPTLKSKLGMDDIAFKLLHSAGLHPVVMDDGRQAFQASQTDHDLTLRSLLEVIAFWHHTEQYNQHHSKLDTETLGLTIAGITRMDTSSALAARWFRHDGSRSQTDAYRSSPPSSALAGALMTLGASERAMDAVLETMYHVNLHRIDSHTPQTQSLYMASLRLFTALDTVLHAQRSQSESLQTLCGIERSRNRFTLQDLESAYRMLGLHRDTSSDSDIVMCYWQRCREATTNGNFAHAKACKEALGLINISRLHPPELEYAYNTALEMSPNEAYEALQIPSEDPHSVEDSMIMTLFDMHVEENPSKRDHLREALAAIAKARNSELLTRFHQTGEKDDLGLGKSYLPAGLNNIGNTCYLNSVLQYFFAVKPLRQAILNAATSATPSLNSGTDRSVGGTKVTTHALQRSVDFVQHLARLFEAMITSPALAVTPEKDLAYLALVSSEVDAQGEDAATKGVFSAADAPRSSENNVSTVTEEPSTLEDETSQPSDGSAARRHTEIPSKRAAEEDAQGVQPTRSKTDPTDADGVQTGDRRTDPADTDAVTLKEIRTDLPTAEADKAQNDVEMADSSLSDGIHTPLLADRRAPPPLPPRPLPPAAAAERRNSLMSLGAQQDVSECLDNVLFQLGVALGDEDKSGDRSDPHTTGEVLPLFTGRTRQVVATITPSESSSRNFTRTNSQDTIRVKNQIFTALPIVVLEEQGKDIYDGLDFFFQEETLSTKGGPSVKRSVTLLEPPPILQIQLQRVQYDTNRRTTYKSQASVEMTDELFMDRYMDTSQLLADDEELSRLASKREQSLPLRQTIDSIRTRIADLRKQMQTSAQDALTRTSAVLNGLRQVKGLDAIHGQIQEEAQRNQASFWDGGNTDKQPVPEEKDLINLSESESQPALNVLDLAQTIPASLPTFLSEESRHVAEEIRDLESQLRDLKAAMEAIWQGEHKYRYKLIAIFMHRGEANHGHYFLEQRRVPPNTATAKDWFKYNDSVVEEVTLQDVLKDKTGANPYLLCYVRQDGDTNDDFTSSRYFETLKRDI